jgi:hypothetical protein
MKAESVLRVVLKIERIGSSLTQTALLQLIPSRYRVWTRSLAHEMSCALKMERLKAADKEKCMTATAKRDNCKLISSVPESTNTDCSVAKEDISPKASILPLGASPQSQETNGVPSVFNPYASKKSKTKATPASRPSPLSLLIEKVKSEVYVKQSSAEIAKRMPGCNESSITCPVCSTAATEPLMAECGHVACLSCWKAWLARSESCPTCREVTTIESLARIVVSGCPDEGAIALTLDGLFPPTAEAFTHSHIGTHDDDEKGSESELELC